MFPPSRALFARKVCNSELKGGRAMSEDGFVTDHTLRQHIGVFLLLVKARKSATKAESNELFAYASTTDKTTGEIKKVRIIL